MTVLEMLFKQFKMKPLVYCFMPDHIHMIIIVDGDKSIVSFVQAFKSKATIESYRFGFKGKIFQSRFFDRFIRTSQNLENEIRYILENPVRKGLVEDYSRYPYSKCFPENIL